MKTYAETHGPLILAHRGGAGEGSENSFEAFQHAIDLGVKHLETDVRLGEDGILYLHHSATSPLPNQLLKPKANGISLIELVDRFPDAFFAIDPKHERAVKPLANLIVRRGLQKQVCIGASFDMRTKRTADLIEALSGVRPYTAMVSAAASAALLINRVQATSLQASYIHVHRRLINARTIDAAHLKGLKIIAWVLNNELQMQNMLEMGIDGFMTDYPSKALAVVRKS